VRDSTLHPLIATPMPPTFRTLSPDECRALLARHQVGRLAYAYRQRVDIEPLHFAVDGDWIVLRTQHGTKLSMLEHQPWVAFEVDEVDALFEWQSVVVHGSVHLVTPAPEPGGDAAWAHAVSIFRRVIPTAFADGDPTPSRDVLLRVHIGHMEGRAASSGAN
jgi:uncharacterized protein